MKSRDIDGRVVATPVAGAASPFGDLALATDVYSVTVEGDFDGNAVVELPVRADLPEDAVLIGAVADREGEWAPLGEELEVIDGRVRIPTTHFSWFTALWTSAADVVDTFRTTILDGLTGGATAEATPPTCTDEPGARRDGYEISSDSNDTVFWCFGMENGQRILRVTNNRRYPLAVSHANATVLDQGFPDGLASLSRLGSGDLTIIVPRATATFGVDLASDGSPVQIETRLDGVGLALYQLEVGLRTAVTLLTRFGVGVPDPTRDFDHYMELLGQVVTSGACLDAVDETVAEGAPGGLIASCFSPAQILDAFGVKGALLAPLMVAGSVIEFFRSEFNALFDQINHRDHYTISITRSAAAALPDLRDDGIGPVRVGMSIDEALATGWLGEERITCSELLGLEPDPDEHTYTFGGPTSPEGLDGQIDFFDGALVEIRVWGGAIAGSSLELPVMASPHDALQTLEAAGYDAELGYMFEPDDYINATEADGDTLSFFFQDGGAAGLPQFTTCD